MSSDLNARLIMTAFIVSMVFGLVALLGTDNERVWRGAVAGIVTAGAVMTALILVQVWR